MTAKTREMVNRLRTAEYEMTVMRVEDYASQGDFQTALAQRRSSIATLKRRLWNATYKSRYVLRPAEEL
jgi:hypothetical protein